MLKLNFEHLDRKTGISFLIDGDPAARDLAAHSCYDVADGLPVLYRFHRPVQLAVSPLATSRQAVRHRVNRL